MFDLARPFLLSVVLGASLSTAAASTVASPGLEPLDFAFRFASAIQSDSKDRAKAQELVIGEYASIGALDEAQERAGTIEGWRRGVVYADLAAAFAKQGNLEQARRLVRLAEEVRKGVTGWENPRISSHVAQALAALGDVDGLTGIATELSASDPRQYAGPAAAAVATGHAAKGEFDKAMDGMTSLGEDDDFEVAWWRTAGYLAIARRDGLPRDKRLEALDAARTSAGAVAGWKRAEALESIAEEYRGLDRRDRAAEALDAAAAVIGPMSEPDATVAPLLSNLARAWAKHGDARRARELLEKAEPLVAAAMSIDRPGIYGNLASSHYQLGEAADAQRLYERALGAAAELENARPRALAVAAVCRQMGRLGYPLTDAMRARLSTLLAGLRDPW